MCHEIKNYIIIYDGKMCSDYKIILQTIMEKYVMRYKIMLQSTRIMEKCAVR